MRILTTTLMLLVCGWATALMANEQNESKAFKECADCPEMVPVPAGKNMLGAEPWAQDMRSTWGPLREIAISYRFAVAKTEITRAQYRAFVNESGHKSSPASCNTWGFNRILGQTEGYTWDNPGYPQREDHPVVCVSWLDATAYASWLAKKTKKPYRLLSATEFEYAARAGTRGPWFWGTDNAQACAYANVADDTFRRLYSYAPVFACNDGWERTAPVASFKSNPWGLHDMLGNAWEWTEDCFHDDMSRAPTDGRAWREDDDGDCDYRTPRGGAWASGTDWLKAFSQSRDPVAYHSQLLGFRVALTLAD